MEEDNLTIQQSESESFGYIAGSSSSLDSENGENETSSIDSSEIDRLSSEVDRLVYRPVIERFLRRVIEQRSQHLRQMYSPG